MLRQLRHISEGHYYGLRVTNNAEVEHLNKELRTLDACKNVQSHCYRKEEKDLVNTLMRLKKSKGHHVEEHFGRHAKHDGSGHSTPRGQRANQHPSREIFAHPSVSHTVDTSLEMASHSRKQPPEHMVLPVESGAEIHRTAGFIDCVICNLPRSSHVKGTAVCTCDKGPDKGTHHMHPPAMHDDRSRPEFLTSRQKRELELQHAKELKKIPDNEDQMFLLKLQQAMTQEIEQRPGIARVQESPHEKQPHSPPRKEENGYGERGNFFPKPRKGSQLKGEGIRARQDSIDEEGPYTKWNRHRRGSHEDFRKRGPSFDYGIRERNESIGGDSYYSVGELRSRTSTLEDSSFFRKTYKIPQAAQLSPSPPERHHYENQHSKHKFSPREDTHLPKLTPEKGGTNEAFHGLIHPDNIINHHHYLPYEADTPSGKPRHNNDHHGHHNDHHGHHNDHHGRQNDHHKRHLQGYYVHKYDHTGARQIMHIPIGVNLHISEMIEKQHEPDSNHFALLSNLRQLLSVYQRMDDTSPKYPWPSPPNVEVTPEEFQKLKDCRYLRLPKSMEDAARDSPVFH